MNKIQRKINETKDWFFEKINKTDKPVAKLGIKKKEHEFKTLVMREVMSLQISQMIKG